MLGGVALARNTERGKSEDLSSSGGEIDISQPDEIVSCHRILNVVGRGEVADFRFSRGTRSEKTLRVAPCFVSAWINRGHVDRFEEGNLNGADGTTKGHRIEGRSVGSRSTRRGACK